MPRSRRLRGIPPDSSPYSMRSFRASKVARKQEDKTYKARVIPPSPAIRIGVQEHLQLEPKLIRKRDCLHVQIQLPEAVAESIKLSVQGDILDIKGDGCYTECLLPFEVVLPGTASYDNGTFCITLETRRTKNG